MASEPAAAAQGPPRRTDPRLLALIVAFAQFMGALDTSVVVTALPQMARSFAVSPLELSLGITAYILVQAALLPTCSWVADRFGSRTVFCAAIVGFTLASVLCGLSHDLPQFVAARVLQGACAAMMIPVGRMVVMQAAEKHELVNVITIGTIPMLFAPTLGPPLGGFIVTYWSWPWIFFINLPIGLIGLALALKFIPNLKNSERRAFDPQGFFMSGAAITTILWGLHEMGQAGPDWLLAGALVGGGGVLAVLAVRHLYAHPTPLIALSSLRFPTFSMTALLPGILARAPSMVLSFVLPLMLQLALGMTAFLAGMLILAISAGDIVLKIFVSRIMRAFGFRRAILTMIAAFALSVAACAAFSKATPLWLIFAVLAANGMFRSVLFSAISTLTFADVPRAEMSGATVLSSIAMQISGAVTVSVSAILLSLSSRLGPTHGEVLALGDYRATLIVAAVLCAASIWPFLRLPADAGGEVSGHRPAG